MAPKQQGRTALHLCDECTAAYDNERELKSHRKIHARLARLRDRAQARRSNHKCGYCESTYATDEGLQEHINEFHFKETDERHACPRCVRYKLPCFDKAPCRWCRIDGLGAQCEIVDPQTAAPVQDTAASPQQQVQIKAEQLQDNMSYQQAEPDSASGHVSPGWSTPRPNSPTERILKLPPRPLPPKDVDIKACGFPPRTTEPGEVNIRAGSLSWLDFDVAYLRTKIPEIQKLIKGGSYRYPPGEPANTIPLDASQVMALDSLGLVFKAPYIPNLVGLSEHSLKSGIDLLRQVVGNYFSTWQKAQPVFHVATCEFEKCPMVVLGAMACIGAVFDKDHETVDQAHHISARCVSELNIMAIGCPDNSLDIMYLAAVCLHQSYVLGSGVENVHSEVNRVRKFLVDRLRNLGLLGGDGLSQDGPPRVFEAPTQSVQAEWAAWVARELEIRTTWAVFEFDCTFSLLTNSPCAIGLRDLPSRFPCSDELYEAPNAHTWNDLRSQSPYHAQGPLVSTVVSATAAKMVLSEHISPWSKRLCTQILERVCVGYMCQSQRESTRTAAQHHGLDPGSVAAQKTESVLRSISFLGKSMHDAAISNPLSTMDLINFSSTMLIRHYTHLSVYSDVMDLIIFITREAASTRLPSSRTSLRWAQQKLIEQFAARPSKSRQCVWHAGQMIRTAKIHARFAPCDHLRTFTAYLVILAFAKYGPQSLRDVDWVEPFPIDQRHDNEKAIENWIQYGGPAKIGYCTLIHAGCRTEKIVQEAFHVLYRLENWGISERFFIILAHFNELNVLG